MGIIIRQTIRSSIYAYLGIALGFITTAFLMPKALTIAEVGLVRLLISLSVLLSQISNLGFNAAGGRLFPYFRDPASKNNGYLFWACTVSLVGLILTLGAVAINYEFVLTILNVKASPLLKEYLYLIFPLTVFATFFMVFDNYARVLFDTVSGTFLKEFGQRVFLFIAVIVYLFKFLDFNQFIIAYVIGMCFPTVLMVIRVWQNGDFSLKNVKGIWTSKLRNEFISLSTLTFLSGFTSQIVNYLDQIQVTSIINLNANGIYATMMMFGTVIYTPTIHISRIGGAIIAEAWKANDLKTIYTVYQKSCLNLLIIGAFLYLIVVVNLPNIFQILPEYEAGKWVVIWIGLGKLFDMSTGLNGLILQTSKYYYFDIIFMIFLILGTWFLNIWLIPIYGINGSAIATTSIILIFNLFRTFFVWFIFGMFPFDLKNLAVVIIGVLVFLLVGLIPQIGKLGFLPSYFNDTLIRSTVICIVYCGVIYYSKLSTDLNSSVDSVLNKLKIW